MKTRALESNQAWLSPVAFLLALCVAWKIGGWIAEGDVSSVIYLALGAGACAIALAILKNWRSGFYIFIAWLFLEDFIRKYMGNSMIIYFAKDALAAMLYVAFLAAVRQRRATFYRFPFLIFLSLFFWLGIIQCFNPNSPSFLYSLLGFKLYFYYIPLLFIGYNLVQRKQDLRRFLIANISWAGVIALLGIAQSILGPSFLNPRTLSEDIRDLSTLYRYAPISGASFYQPNSVFVSAGRFDSYLMLAWLVGMGGVGYILLQRCRGQFVTLAGLALVAVATLMCGGRGALVYVVASGPVLAIAFLWGAPRRLKQTHRIVKAVWRTALAAGTSLLIAAVLFPQAIGARWSYYTETLLPSSPAEQLTSRVNVYPLQELEKAFQQGNWISGHGLGTASLGVQYVSQWLGKGRPGFAVESGYGNIVLELGIAGLLLWFCWTAALLIHSFKILRQLRQTAFFPLAFAIFWFAFLLLYPATYTSINGFQDYIYNAYLWLLIGILYRLPVLASEQEEAVRTNRLGTWTISHV